ncbi:MAG: hypothetical protein SFV54_06775, partial [Bryobacteraceae bacterium]|nr:hypothetical protein [Bryobacteraceae bacterium]
ATLDYINRHQALAHRHLHRDLDQLRALQRDHLEGRVPDDTYNFDRPATSPNDSNPGAETTPPPAPAPAPDLVPDAQPLKPAAPVESTSGNPNKISAETNLAPPQPSTCQPVSVPRDTTQPRSFRRPGRPATLAARRFLSARRRRR